jgi:hypothetical protein
MQMSASEQARWAGHQQTPVIFNHHAPIEINSSSIQHVDLNKVKSTTQAVLNEERVLILTPLRNAGNYLDKYFELVSQLTYPHHLIDLAFLVGDSDDDTLGILSMELERVQSRNDKVPFHSVMIVEKDFPNKELVSMSVEDRHGFKAQAPRRRTMGKARNFLLSAALKPEHSWVYWRDVDIQDSPNKILEDLIAHDRDVIVPSRFRKEIEYSDEWQLTIWQTSGSTATRTAAILRDASITTHGRSPRPAASLRHLLTLVSFLLKVRSHLHNVLLKSLLT